MTQTPDPFAADDSRAPMAGEGASDRLEILLSRCAMRDEKALEELYREVSGHLLAVLMRILRSRAMAEEALQDVIVKVWQRADQYSSYRGRALTWLTSIARYRAIDLLRASQSHTSLNDTPDASLADDSADLSETITSEKLQLSLQDCLSRLSPLQQRCISLAYVDGYSQDEIATTTGNPLGTIKSWVRRGLASLKRCLES